ncbi:hypothetical protein HCU40_13780 [Pseudanabaena biceps]|nr:hypothetical protein [Pseudanabaena biceps]
MVAKRDFSPRFSPEMSRQAKRKSPSQLGINRIVGKGSYDSLATSRSKVTSLVANPNFSNIVNDYSDAVAHNIQIKRKSYYRAKTIESVIVIAVNAALSLVAIATISSLLPYQSSQKDRLDEINSEVNTVEQRVNGMRENLPDSLNTGRSKELLLRKHGYIKNNQVTIKVLDPSQIASPDNDGVMPTTSTAQKINRD